MGSGNSRPLDTNWQQFQMEHMQQMQQYQMEHMQQMQQLNEMNMEQMNFQPRFSQHMPITFNLNNLVNLSGNDGMVQKELSEEEKEELEKILEDQLKITTGSGVIVPEVVARNRGDLEVKYDLSNCFNC